MKHKTLLAVLGLAVLLGVLIFVPSGMVGAQEPEPHDNAGLQAALGTAFTYQGRLDDGGSAANGTYDFEFKLYDAASGGGQVGSTIAKGDVTVTNGLFSVELDFGSGAFTGDARWLEIGVRAGSSTGAHTSLTPRQPLTPTPYALGMWALRTDANGNIGIGTTPSDDYKLYVEGENRGIYAVATAGTDSVRPYGVVASVDTDQALTTGGGFLSDIHTANTPNTGFVFGGKFEVNDDGDKNARGLTIILNNEENDDYGLELVVDEPGYAIRSTDTGKMHFAGDVGIGTTPSDDYKLYVEGENRGIYAVATAGTDSVRPYGVVASVDTDQALTTGGGFLSDIHTANTPNTGYVFGGKFEVNDDGDKNARGLTIILNSEESNDYGLELVVDEPGYAIRSADTGKVYFAGNVGIGTENPQDKLEVSGGNIRVTGGSFIDDGTTLDVPDYVFEEDYHLMPLDELQVYIAQEKHLPNVPSLEEIKKNGLNLSQFQIRLLEKVEELTLYTLTQQEILETRQQQLAVVQQQNSELSAQLAMLEARLATLERQPTASVAKLEGWAPLVLLVSGLLVGLVIAGRKVIPRQPPGGEQ